MGARPSSFQLSSPGPLRLYSTAELLNLPAPTWLIDTIMPQGALVGLYAPPESFKSFVAIDLALCVATGIPWHGYTVEQGLVVYVAAEGGSGISKRVRAWLHHHDLSASDPQIAWLIESMIMAKGSDDVECLSDRIDDIGREPRLIIVDTLARCFEGDENAQGDMGAFIGGLDHFRREFGSTIMAVHHTRLDGDRERGSTAFRGGTDTLMSLSRSKSTMELECTKQKDAEHFPTMTFELVPEPENDSCVIVRTDSIREQQKAAKTQGIIELLTKFGELTWDDWSQLSGLSNGTFQRTFVGVKDLGLIAKENGKWHLV